MKDNYITCRFFYKKVFHINTDDILYVKRHKGHSKTQGTYYKDKYTLFLKNEKKFRINCFIFRNSSDINFFFTNITRLYNENYIEDIQNKKSIFCDTYHEDKYRFYVLRDGFIFLLTLCLLFLFIFLIFNRIFFPAIIVFAILAAIPAIPVKIIMNISKKTITLKSAFGIKIRKISGYDTKQIIITNNFNISVTAILDENRKKQKTFSLSLYKPKDRGKIFEILHIIFQNKVLYTLNGDEPLI